MDLLTCESPGGPRSTGPGLRPHPDRPLLRCHPPAYRRWAARWAATFRAMPTLRSPDEFTAPPRTRADYPKVSAAAIPARPAAAVRLRRPRRHAGRNRLGVVLGPPKGPGAPGLRLEAAGSAEKAAAWRPRPGYTVVWTRAAV